MSHQEEPTKRFEWIVLDAGNVLVGTDENRFLRMLAENGPYSLQELRAAVLCHDGPLDRYERGRISTDEFLAAIRDKFAPDARVTDIERAFVSVIVLWEETQRILETLSAGHRLGIISDTSPLHFTRGILPATQPYVDVYTLSCDTGTKKPDPDMFRRFLSQAAAISRATPPASSDCVFLDDKPANVVAAREMGFEGDVVNGSAELVATLTRLGLM